MPAPVVPASLVPAPVAPAPVVPAPIVPAPVVPAPLAPVAPVPAEALPLPAVSRIVIPATTRAVPQSERDLLLQVQTFMTHMNTIDLTAKIATAKTTTVQGHADLIDTLARISSLVQKIGTTH